MDARAGHPAESMLLGVLIAAFVFAILVDLIAALSAVATGAGWAWTPPADMIEVLERLPATLDNPRAAWPRSTREALPGAGVMYAITLVVLLLPAVAVALLSRRRRPRSSAGSSARWATRWQLRPLYAGKDRHGRLPLGVAHHRRLAAERRQSVLVIAPTQSGKTTALAIPAILEWKGPVIATSVKTDLVRDTITHRRTLGLTQIFDPTGSTGLPDTDSWTPLASCRTWQGARQTAAWMTDAASLRRGGISDGDFWYAAAAKLLAPLLYAAAVTGCTMEQVVEWLDTQESGSVLAALKYAGSTAALNAMEATWARDERQRSSVYTTAETIIEAYADPGVLANSVRPDIRADEFLNGSGTIYLCATARNQKRLRPVFVTLLQEILEEAYGRSSASGRPLDPPLS